MQTISPSVFNIASFKLQALSMLRETGSSSTDLFMAATSGVSPAALLSQFPARVEHAASGRNLALHDPESAYRMMTVINTKEALYKAQFHALGRMRDALDGMAEAARNLDLDPAQKQGEAVAEVESFLARYNDWVREFAPDMGRGGLLADTQAAQMARRALDQSVDNIFHGAKDGMHGLASLGITTDPATGIASLDQPRLESALTSNPQAVADTIDAFAAHFAEAARLLNSAGNFMPRQLDNLDRAIDYIADNIEDWRSEFGTGEAARPGQNIALALAAYNRTMSF